MSKPEIKKTLGFDRGYCHAMALIAPGAFCG